MTTSANVHEFRQSMATNLEETSLYALPPSLNVQSRVKWDDYLTTTNQKMQNINREFTPKLETRYSKPKLCDEVTYLKDFCEKICRKPYTVYGVNTTKFQKHSETKNKYVEKLAECQSIAAVGEQRWKVANNNQLTSNLAQFKKDIKSYSEGLEKLDFCQDPYSTTSQRVHRLFTPKELYDGIAKQDIVTFHTETDPRPVKQDRMRTLAPNPLSTVAGRTKPCMLAKDKKRSTRSWPHYASACNRNTSKRPLKSETKRAFTRDALVNYEIRSEYQENRNKIPSEVVEHDFSVPFCANMYKTMSSDIGKNEPIVLV